VRADRGAARQFPAAGTVAERLAGQGANRAQVDDVARQLGRHLAFQKWHHFGVLAAPRHTEFHHAGDFLPEAHAAAAMDATRHIGGDQRAEVLVAHHALDFLVARRRAAIAHRQILQRAFAALIADRAVERMVDEQELHHTFLRIDRVFRAGVHLHAVGHRCGAGRQRLGRLFHLHQTHAAAGGDGEFLVITEMRDRDAGLIRRIHDGVATFDLERAAINFDIKRSHGYCSVPTMQHLCSMWCSNSWPKCLRKLCTGSAAASPSAQMVWPPMRPATLLSRSMSSGRPCPCSMR